jgi:hypothetical protein
MGKKRFDYIGAKNEGYSDAEIQGYLKQANIEFDLEGAVNEGYTPQEIDDYLNTTTTPPKKKATAVGSASLGGSVASPTQSTKTAQGSGSSPSKGNQDWGAIARGDFSVSGTPKKEIKVTILDGNQETYSQKVKRKLDKGVPLNKKEAKVAKEGLAQIPFFGDEIKGMSDAQINQGLSAANAMNTDDINQNIRYSNEEANVKKRIQSGDVTPQDLKKAKDAGFFWNLDDKEVDALAFGWNKEIKDAKIEVDTQLKNDIGNIFKEQEYLNGIISNVDFEINKINQAKRRSSYEDGLKLDAQINKLESVKSQAEAKKKRKDKYLDDLSRKTMADAIEEMISFRGYDLDKDENGLLTGIGRQEVAHLVNEFTAAQKPERKFLLSYINKGNEKGNLFLENELASAIERIPKEKSKYVNVVNEKTKNLPEEAKTLIGEVAGVGGYVKGKGFSDLHNTADGFKEVNTMNFMEFKGIIDKENALLEEYINSPQVQQVLGSQIKSLEDKYNSGAIDGVSYRNERLKLLSSNQQTRPYVQKYINSINNGNDIYSKKNEKYLNSKKVDYAKYTKLDKNGNILSIAGMKPNDFIDMVSDLGYDKEGIDQEVSETISNDKESRGNEFARKTGVFSGTNAPTNLFLMSFLEGAANLTESRFKWLYDKTGFDFMNNIREGASGMLTHFNQLGESTIGKSEFNLETGDYLGALKPNYIIHTFGSSAPHMAEGMIVGGGVGMAMKGGLLAAGLAEGIGTATTLSKTGRIVQKVGAGLFGGSNDAFTNMQMNYTDLVKQGYSLDDADRISKEAALRELPINVVTSVLELESLFRATAKPTLKMVTTRGATTVAEQGIEGFQEVNQALSLEKAKGSDVGIIDYAFNDNEGFNNFMGGVVGGISMGAPMTLFGLTKDMKNWNRLYNVSREDMQSSVRYGAVANMVRGVSDVQLQATLGTMAVNRDDARNAYIAIPESDSKKKAEAKANYINALSTYEYAKEYSEQAANVDVTDIEGDYIAHNKAVAAQYQALANNASEKNKSSYQKQADYYASIADKSEQGKPVPIYSFDTDKGRVFVSERTAKTLAEGSIKQKNDAFDEAVMSGAITGIEVVGDKETSNMLSEKYQQAKDRKVAPTTPQANPSFVIVEETDGTFSIVVNNEKKESFPTKQQASDRVVELNQEIENNAAKDTKTQSAESTTTNGQNIVPETEAQNNEDVTTVEIGKPVEAKLNGESVTVEKTEDGYTYTTNGIVVDVTNEEHQANIDDKSIEMPVAEVGGKEVTPPTSESSTPATETAPIAEVKTVPVTGLVKAFCLSLKVTQSVELNAPLFIDDAVGTFNVITGVVVPFATLEFKSVPEVPKVSAETLVTLPVP